MLCIAITDCLHKTFLNDTDGFVNKQRFDILMQPMVDQVYFIILQILFIVMVTFMNSLFIFLIV